jgi:8-oxo-dGTP pyrophosphatase MutT (NUDIX family)
MSRSRSVKLGKGVLVPQARIAIVIDGAEIGQRLLQQRQAGGYLRGDLYRDSCG